MLHHLLRTIEQLETELGYLPHRWQHHWSLLEPPPAHPPPPPPGNTSTALGVANKNPFAIQELLGLGSNDHQVRGWR